jgi:thiamine-monophosphate kinase
MTRISQIGEFNLIKLIADEFTCGDGVEKGIGDDTAVLSLTPGARLLAASDMLVEGRHFLFDQVTPYQLGYKALAVNISDVAAMGGVPRFALFSTGWPEYVTVEYVQEFYRGVKALAGKHQVSIVGGDTVNSPQVVVDVTILGETMDRTVFRNGAQPGNLLGVTGTLGDSAAGLAWLLQPKADHTGNQLESWHNNEPAVSHVINRHFLPEPRVKAGQLLSALGATAMMDISDGLASEVNHICGQSETGGIIEAANIPLSPAVKEVARILGKDPLDWALYGGEDYELLAAFPREQLEPIRKALAELGLSFTVIGEIIKDPDKIMLVDCQGQSLPLVARGFDHFQQRGTDND